MLCRNLKNTERIKEDYYLENWDDVKLQIRVKDNGGKWIDCNLTEEELNSEKIWPGDIRVKPIKDFEVGDWIIVYNEIKMINKHNIAYYDGTNYMAQERYAKHWFPDEDEYMWFYNNSTDYHFGLYYKSTIDAAVQRFYYSKEKRTRFEFVEPFSNQIPLFLK